MKKLIFLLLFLFACNHVPAPQKSAVFKYTPESVVNSVYLVDIFTATGAQISSGTAWKYDEDIVISAGHVCDSPGHFILTNYKGELFIARPIRFTEDPDLCIMSAPGVTGPSLNRFASVDYGDEVWYTGAPRGLFGKGFAPFDKGHVAGEGVALLLADLGASGSPMYTKDGVVGVLVGTWGNTKIFKFETVDKLREFLSE